MPEETPDPGNFYARLASSISAEYRRFLRDSNSCFDAHMPIPRVAYSYEELRAQSAADFNHLMQAIMDAKMRAVTQGSEPNEVLLGPKQARIVEVEMNWQSREKGPSDMRENVDAMIRGNMDGVQISGLRIRAMKQDGVRVAITFSPGGD